MPWILMALNHGFSGLLLAWPWARLEAGQMAQMTRYRRDLHARPSGEGGDDFVRILTELTGDLERFDSLIDDQRRMLEQSRGQPGRGHDTGRQSLRLEAAEMATRTRKALARLRRMLEPA
jgi:hypothetical protein